MIAMPKLFTDNKVNPNVFQAAIARFFKRSWADNSAASGLNGRHSVARYCSRAWNQDCCCRPISCRLRRWEP